ncbi:MAG: hypothetical protein OCC49_12935 [Fibrobacterales bacterium]
MYPFLLSLCTAFFVFGCTLSPDDEHNGSIAGATQTTNTIATLKVQVSEGHNSFVDDITVHLFEVTSHLTLVKSQELTITSETTGEFLFSRLPEGTYYIAFYFNDTIIGEVDSVTVHEDSPTQLAKKEVSQSPITPRYDTVDELLEPISNSSQESSSSPASSSSPYGDNHFIPNIFNQVSGTDHSGELIFHAPLNKTNLFKNGDNVNSKVNFSVNQLFMYQSAISFHDSTFIGFKFTAKHNTSTMTLSLFTKVDSFPTTPARLFHRGHFDDMGTLTEGYSLNTIKSEDNIIAFEWTNQTGVTHNTPLQFTEAKENQWYMITITLTPDRISMEVNGILIEERMRNGTPAHLNNQPIAGAQTMDTTTNSNFFYGAISDIRLYDAALSQQDVFSNIYFVSENSADACIDGFDNDSDGLYDCSDPDCATQARCIECITPPSINNSLPLSYCNINMELTPLLCSDGYDNDDNGLNDCDEPECKNTFVCQVTHTDLSTCQLLQDINNDGVIDFGAPDCCAIYDGCP